MIYMTGDTHGEFGRIVDFCRRVGTSKKDIMIILGDAGINYYENKRDDRLKQYLSLLPITFFCIHGNHECRAENMPDKYHTRFFHKGTVLIEDKYPNIIFALDGEVYDFNDCKTMVIGGAYSVDKEYRLSQGWKWWPDEQPSDEIKQYVRNKLAFNCNQMDVFLTHTSPKSDMPTEAFLSGIDQSKVDNSTEEFLEDIAKMCEYKAWFAGHFHIDKWPDHEHHTKFLFNNIVEFPTRQELYE